MLDAETYAYIDCYEAILTIRDDLSRIMRRGIPIARLAEFAFLFNVIAKSSRTSERRLMIDLIATWEVPKRLKLMTFVCEIECGL